MMWFIFFFFFFGLGTSSPELSTDELCCRFFEVASGSGAVSAAGSVEAGADSSVTGGDGLMGRKSNSSGGGMGPFFVLVPTM